MNDGLPDAPPASLIGRIGQAVRGLRFDRHLRLALAVALLLAAGPVLTIAGAGMLEARLRTTIAERGNDAPADGEDARLRQLVARPGVGATIEALARALPGDARLARVERDADGGLRIDVTTPDPDRLRTALRAAPETRGLRDAGQRGGDGAMVVSFADRP